MVNPHSVSFCVSYAGCLGATSALALYCISRSRHPLASFRVGLATLATTFASALWLEGGLVSAGQADYQMGLPYPYFIRTAFAVFLVFFVVRGGYLLRHVSKRTSHNPA